MAVDKVAERKYMVRSACDDLAKLGIKPSVSAIKRAGLPIRGSDPDVQRDVNDWFDGVLLAHSNKNEVAGIPRTMLTLFAGVVEAAREEARRELELERQAIEAAAVDADVKAAAADLRASTLASELAVANEGIAGRDALLRRQEEAMAELRATQRAKDERITGLVEDLNRKSEEHAASLVELKGVRNHSLLQIDEARTEGRHWRTEFERVDQENKSSVITYRQKASGLENLLATANGRLSTMHGLEEALANNQTALANNQKLVTSLEQQLQDIRNTVSSKPEIGVPKRFQARKARNLIKQRKL